VEVVAVVLELIANLALAVIEVSAACWRQPPHNLR
jgi:hypothetical protein